MRRSIGSENRQEEHCKSFSNSLLLWFRISSFATETNSRPCSLPRILWMRARLLRKRQSRRMLRCQKKDCNNKTKRTKNFWQILLLMMELHICRGEAPSLSSTRSSHSLTLRFIPFQFLKVSSRAQVASPSLRWRQVRPRYLSIFQKWAKSKVQMIKSTERLELLRSGASLRSWSK